MCNFGKWHSLNFRFAFYYSFSSVVYYFAGTMQHYYLYFKIRRLVDKLRVKEAHYALILKLLFLRCPNKRS